MTIDFKTITTDEEARMLMPGSETELNLVLFCGRETPMVGKAQSFLGESDLPDDWGFAVLDPAEATETARWFGISDHPAMAAIYDGSILAVEYECSVDAFSRLIEFAQKQYDRNHLL